ncbi:tetratricopeptide repeat protein [Virgibacillus dakarensis]|uniref:Tetratricopeptide repeat protein n=1 Tax=Lentibacillus populi TaxID=1827502 RepID=A0A9W5X788_9BACI|nr:MULTISPECIES: hypothetical protein [Bacillaceae]MBT2216272.1 tetratricopeptide repeat protein [Virgibacillus dakarensis]MTW86964.1 tetratricopeptide repeat protein [Virgibacillus dakarensis]GGB57585.1 hypothetical protein GCM10011409_38840 [Lentibacillus populi]
MPGAQINPLLIQQLTDKEITEIQKFPTLSSLPGKYARLINRQKENIPKHFEENSFMLTCKSCGRKGKYDVGLMVVNVDREEDGEGTEYPIQTTGYFRCKHCNDAGNWEMPSQFIIASMAGILAKGSFGMENRCTVGKNLLYDGSWHLFSSDAELHLLHQLKEDPDNSFVWNRLGNLYDKGNRPEIAACVYEYSVVIDPGQIESHYTLGQYFFQIKDLERAAHHYKQMLLGASEYQLLAAEDLRQMVASGLANLFDVFQESNGNIPFLPTKEELESAGKLKEMEKYVVDMKVDIVEGELESFYPFAEIYMGAQSKKLPNRLRTLKVPKPATKKKKKWKKRKKKQR